MTDKKRSGEMRVFEDEQEEMKRMEDELREGRTTPKAARSGSSATEPMEGLLRVQEVARILNLSPKAVYGLGARGVLPRVRVGRQVRWRPCDVRRLVEAAGKVGEE